MLRRGGAWNLLGTFELEAGSGIRIVRAVAAGEIAYVHTDHLGQPQKLTDATASLLWARVALPFGATHSEAGLGETSIRFPGQWADAESGLHYNYFRDYDPSLGRYIESDPIGLAGGLNTYGYVGGSPVMRVDPKGLDIAIIENGPTAGNPVGHTAIAVSGEGVYSYGNGVEPGSSLEDYLRREAPRRDSTVYVLTTSAEQDAAALAYLQQFPDNTLPDDLLSVFLADNCAVRSNFALDAAGLPYLYFTRLGMPVALLPNQPGTAGIRARIAGAKATPIPKGSNSSPGSLKQFEPK